MINNYFNKFSNKGIPFMSGREKGDITALVGEVLHIVDFGFIKKYGDEYPVIAFREYPETFYFGGTVLNDMLHTIDADGMREALAQQAVTLTKVTSRQGREYMGVEFVEA